LRRGSARASRALFGALAEELSKPNVKHHVFLRTRIFPAGRRKLHARARALPRFDADDAMSGAIEFRLNGQPVRLDSVSPNITLLDWLRSSGLTGSKEGCAEGDCGACSVAIVDVDRHGQATYRAINSCLVPLSLMADRDIVTVEGVAPGKLHPVQQAMVDNHGSQCGYCTPGFIMSMFEGYYRKDLTTATQLDEQLCGNLCRCTGYRAIRDACADAFAARTDGDVFTRRLAEASSKLNAVDYSQNGEKFLRPCSLKDLFAALAAHPQARLIAGATELGLDISKRFQKFPTLISVEAIPELTELRETKTEWHIGAGVTLTRIKDLLGYEYPELDEMLYLFGSRQIRNRATMGGNIVTASPIGDSAPVLLALNARVVIAAAGGERLLPIDEFFVSYRKTALQPGEILKTIIVPRPADSSRSVRRFYKVSKRREMDISTVAACFALQLDASKTICEARLAFGGVAAMPSRARKTEQALLGKQWNETTLRDASPILECEFTPISDVRGSATYRQRLITSLLEKFYFDSISLTPDFSPVTNDRPNASAVSTASISAKTVKTVGEERGSISTGLKASVNESERPIARSLGRREPALPHESGHKHVSGEAIYVDDATVGQNMLEVWPVCAPHAHARILRRDAAAASAMPGVSAVLMAEDVPGLNDVGAVRHDEILLAENEIFYHGQIVALVVGETQDICRAAAARVVVDYEPLPPVLTIEEAIAANSFHTEANHIERGDVGRALQIALLKFSSEISFGGQDHFYLETNAAWAERGEDGTIFVSSSTQHPSEVQHIVAHVLALPMHSVVVESPRMGGGFGGKETQAAIIAALAALAATKTGRRVRVRLNRDQDMMITGKRHPFLAKFSIGFNQEGLIQAGRIDLFSNAGWSLDLSRAVTDRAVFHLDNAYYIPHVAFRGHVAKTNLASNTAFRGFGGPQGMFVIEEIIDRIARRTGLPPEVVRQKNLYHGRGETNTTHYGQEIEDNRIQRVWEELLASSNFAARRDEISTWNERNPHRKRGLAITPVKFGISFTTTHLNQAGALVLLFQDGTAQINHGGTEMGQGVHTNIREIAAKELGLTPDRVRVMHTRTDKVSNTSATAASCGTDLNGAAVKNACDILRSRLLPFATEMLKEKNGRPPAEIRFAENTIFDPQTSHARVTVAELIQRAYFARTSLSTTGFYKTPDIYFDRETGQGKPFHYFAVGAAVTEVEVDGFTGMTRMRRVDILHDTGDAVNRGVARGQIEGGFVQGAGWLTNEELVWDSHGQLLTHSPDTYKIPAVGDTPEIFNVEFLSQATQSNVIHGSKAVGEPPLMLALSVREAIRDAIAAFGPPGGEVALASPATCEAISNAIASRLGKTKLEEKTEHATAEQLLS
jgi:xanthine dehydrogenase molybdopterin binding subunit/xanthine dehydrogenase small subunit